MDQTSQTLGYADVLRDASRGVMKVPQKEFLDEGLYPVIDQGQQLIAGYWNGDNGLFRDVPAIVFGDHTRCIKYIEEPFVAGADGVKILKPVRSNDNPRYLYHALRAADIPSLGYSRHFKLVKELSFHVAERAEQDRIVEHLDSIEHQLILADNQIEKYDKLIKSRFVEMFGDPLENPKQVPIMRIDEIADVQTGATPLRSNAAYYGGAIPWVKTGEVAAGLLEEPEETITELALQETNCKLFPAGTILVAMYGQGDTRGKAAILRQEAATNQACAAILLNEGYDADFILAQLNLRYEDLRSRSLGGNQKNLSLKIIKAYELIVPPIEQQRAFMSFVQQADKLKFETQQVIDKLQMLYDSLAQEYFGS